MRFVEGGETASEERERESGSEQGCCCFSQEWSGVEESVKKVRERERGDGRGIHRREEVERGEECSCPGRERESGRDDCCCTWSPPTPHTQREG